MYNLIALLCNIVGTLDEDIQGLVWEFLLVFIGMKDMHLEHKDLNSSHKISIGIDVKSY